MGLFLYDDCLHGFHVMVGTMFITVIFYVFYGVIYSATSFRLNLAPGIGILLMCMVICYLVIYCWVDIALALTGSKKKPLLKKVKTYLN